MDRTEEMWSREWFCEATRVIVSGRYMNKFDDVGGDGFPDSVVRNGIMFLFELTRWDACI